jgi:hypothetical protein
MNPETEAAYRGVRPISHETRQGERELFFAAHRLFTLKPRLCRYGEQGWSLWWLWFEVANIAKQPRAITATVTPYKCDNPNHDKGCGLGWRLVQCEEHEAHTWIAAIDAGNHRLWSCSNVESQSRADATTALLNRLAEGVQLS